jgi:hypothetical protein
MFGRAPTRVSIATPMSAWGAERNPVTALVPQPSASATKVFGGCSWILQSPTLLVRVALLQRPRFAPLSDFSACSGRPCTAPPSSITTVTRLFGNLVLNRVELCCRLNVQILVARIHVRRQLSPRVGNYLNSRLVHVRCHLTSRPLMTLRDVNS